MKRTSLAVFVLLLLFLGPAGRVQAEPLTFQGKALCSEKEEFSWPFTRDPVRAEKNFKPGMAVSLQPPKPDDEKSATELGADMGYLKVLSVDARVGQAVNAGRRLVTYAIPLDIVMSRKEAMSRGKLNDLECSLAKANFHLTSLALKQEEIEKGLSMEAYATEARRQAAMSMESLLKQRDLLSGAYDLTKSRYDIDMDAYRSVYGPDFDPRQFPREDSIRPAKAGYVLWVNPSLVPGMIFTKPAKLLVVGTMAPILIRAAVHETGIGKIKEGDPATITCQSLPGQTFQTTVSWISPTAQPATMQQPSFYEIELSLPNPDLRIKEGMRCDVSVTVPDTPR